MFEKEKLPIHKHGKCECGYTGVLEKHRKYTQLPLVIYVCRKCHLEIHEQKGK